MLTNQHSDYQKSSLINIYYSYVSDFKEVHIIFQVYVCEVLINNVGFCSVGIYAYRRNWYIVIREWCETQFVWMFMFIYPAH